MSTAHQLINTKAQKNAWLPPSATVLEAAQLMNDRHIGSIMVISDDQLAGIFTERDVMRRVVAEKLAPESTQIADVMTSPVPSHPCVAA